MRAVVDEAAFLALSEDDVINLDAAVRQLESMAALLLELATRERGELLAFVEAEASREPNPERRDFLRKFADDMGF